MNLSERASKYLKSLKRNLEWTSDEDETRAYLINQNIHPFSEFLRFQMLYSGYELTIEGASGHSFSACLFSKEQISENVKLDIEKAGNRLVGNCGEHKTAQFEFLITDRGEICTLDEEELPNILYSSFDKMLEEYALRNEIANWDANPYYFEVKNLNNLIMTMHHEFQIIEECSDEYSTWWRSKDFITVKGIWLDRPLPYFHVYGQKREKCDDLIERLQTERILK